MSASRDAAAATSAAAATTKIKNKTESEEAKRKGPSNSNDHDDDPLTTIPEEYRKHGVDTEPLLYYLHQVESPGDLEQLLEAAQRDVQLHHARIQAAAFNQPSLLLDYNYLQDPTNLARQERLKERTDFVTKLYKEAPQIIKDLQEEKKDLTQAERTQVKLARWQRALELYVYCPSQLNMDLLGLLDKLLDGTSEVSAVSMLLLCMT